MSTDHPDTLAVTLRWLDGTSDETHRMTTPSITEFLRARYAHERVIGEIVARSSLGPTSLILRDLDAKLAIVEDVSAYCWTRGSNGGPCGACDRIGCRTLRKLAQPFSDHDDYDPTWTDPDPKD